MASKKILLIGMLDSIHVGRWISQFEGTETTFVLYPSKKFRRINPLILNHISKKSKLDARLHNQWVPKGVFGYFDFAFKVLPLRVRLNLRARSLRILLMRHEFDFIHALEIQGAGYLLTESLSGLMKPTGKVIITNYGSDIYFFSHSPEHKARIQSALQIADYYSAECSRDYKLAHELGFDGMDLPCIPNAGGFKINFSIGEKASDRNQIIVKCYGGRFGLGAMVIQALHVVLGRFHEYQVFLYSVTEDLLQEAQLLSDKFSDRVRIRIHSNPLPREQLIREFANSRVYVGASRSDGISTSFLEALVEGAFPIQTNTSCADEWILKGAVAILPDSNSKSIEGAILEALTDNDLVDSAQIQNHLIAKKYLDESQIKDVARIFYSRS
jgi:hypothetical protein